MLVTAIQHQQQELQKMLTAEDASNPLVAAQMRSAKAMLDAEERHRKQLAELRESNTKENRALHSQVRELTERVSVQLERDEGDERVAEAEEAGTRKGFSFEERVHDAIERIAGSPRRLRRPTPAPRAPRAAARRATCSSSSAPPTGPRAGGSSSRSRTGSSRKNAAWTELNEAMAARAASFGVLVVAGEDRVPARTRAAARVRGQQADRRGRSRRARRRSRSPSPTGSLPHGCRWPGTAS